MLAVDLLVLPQLSWYLFNDWVNRNLQILKKELIQSSHAVYKRRQREIEPTTSEFVVRHFNCSTITLHNLKYKVLGQQLTTKLLYFASMRESTL